MHSIYYRPYQISASLIDQEEEVLHTYGDLRVRIMTYYCHVMSIHYHLLTIHIRLYTFTCTSYTYTGVEWAVLLQPDGQSRPHYHTHLILC